MHGAAPADSTPFAVEIAVMREMRWTWSALQETPAAVVEAVVERIAAERHWQSEQAKMRKATHK